jgi:hypothetical protein
MNKILIQEIKEVRDWVILALTLFVGLFIGILV